MTQEEIEKKVAELSLRENSKVLPIVFKDEDTDEDVVGFIREPNRMVKLRVMDKSISAPATASAELFDAILLKNDSDIRFSSEDSKDDKYYLGGAMEAFKLVEISINTFKKK